MYRNTLIALVALSLPLAPQLGAQAKDSLPPAIYTEAQATHGEAVFMKVCNECHTRPDYSSPDFKLRWNGQTVYDLFDRIRTTMPDSKPGGLQPDEYLDVTAYLLKLNGYPAGTAALAGDETMNKFKLIFPPKAPAPTFEFGPARTTSNPPSFQKHSRG